MKKKIDVFSFILAGVCISFFLFDFYQANSKEYLYLFLFVAFILQGLKKYILPKFYYVFIALITAGAIVSLFF